MIRILLSESPRLREVLGLNFRCKLSERDFLLPVRGVM